MSNVTNPSSIPYFNAKLSTTTSNVTGDGTTFTCIWDTLASGSGYNTSTGIYTVPQGMSGYYCFNVYMKIDGLTSSHTFYQVSIVTTGGSFVIDELSMANYRSSSNDAGRHLTTVPSFLNAGNTVKVNLQVSGGTKVVSFNSLSRLSAMRFYQ